MGFSSTPFHRGRSKGLLSFTCCELSTWAAATAHVRHGNVQLSTRFDVGLCPANPREFPAGPASLLPALPPADKSTEAPGVRQHLGDGTGK